VRAVAAIFIGRKSHRQHVRVLVAGLSSIAKRRIDIEQLLAWAYVEELPKRGPGGLSGLSRMLDYGTSIDISHHETEPIAFGEPHPDALLLDYHVRSLPPVRFTTAMARHLLGALLAPYLMREVVHTVKTIMIRRGDRDIAGIVGAERTEQITEVEKRELSPAALIAVHARLGNRPNWQVGPWRITRVNGKNNKPIVHGISRGHRYNTGAYCPLQLAPSAETIARARFEYAVWWMSLMELAESCRLSAHVALPPRAAAEPWVTGEEAPEKIHRGGEAQIPEQRQRHFVKLPPLRTRSGKAVRVPLTTPDDVPC
jgi:hypothetical protein